MTGELKRDLAEGRVVLGGCCVSEHDPAWQCVECGAEIFKWSPANSLLDSWMSWTQKESQLPKEMYQIYVDVLKFAEHRFELSVDGIHGRKHWLNVVKNGLFIAQQSDEPLDQRVILLFGLLHDVERRDDGIDPDHGHRAAKLIPSLQGKLFQVSQRQLTCLVEACDQHAGGTFHDDPTVRACWDADRLDLTRLDKVVDSKRLLTPIGRQLALALEELNSEGSI